MKKALLVPATAAFLGGIWFLTGLPVPLQADPQGRFVFRPYVSMPIESVDFSQGVVPRGWPVNKSGTVISSEFGRRRHPIYKIVRQHNGIDFAVGKGNPVYATAEGIVTFAGTLVHYGEIVKIWHEGDFHTFYAHNSEVKVKTGDRVRRGELIAYSGSTGISTGPHLHYEVRKRGVPQNPRLFLN